MQLNLNKLENLKIVGMKIKTSNSLSVNFLLISKLWRDFNKKLFQIRNRIIKSDWCKFGISLNFSLDIPYHYIACVEVYDLNTIPNGMVGILIPSMQYIVYTHQGDYHQLGDTLKNILSKNQQKECDFIEYYNSQFKYARIDSKIMIYSPIEKIHPKFFSV